MNILGFKLLKLLLWDWFTFWGGSPPPAQPTTMTTNTSNLPPYIQPYLEANLGAAQQQVYNIDSSGNITGIKPYVPYSSNPQDYVAPFSPLQQQSQTGVSNLQLPGGYQTGTDVTGAATSGTADTIGGAQGYGAMGAGVGAQALASQNQLVNQIQDPQTMQNLMSTFQNYNLPAQQQLLNQQYDINSAQEQSAATSAGAFGGSREALASGLNQQNRGLAQSNLIGTAYNTAYTDATNALTQNVGQNIQEQGLGIQGAQTGLAGEQAALQGYGQIGNLGQQFANIGGQGLEEQEGIYGLQAQTGATQQQQQQNIINQAVQNYAMAQQYPYQQLSFLSNMIHGLPLTATTTQNYQAAPSTASQIAGLGTAGIAGLGLYNSMSQASDVRQKENIVLVGKLDNGLNWYEFDYKPEYKDDCGHGRYRGVMAQEVEEINPQAVITLEDGFKAVKYAMIGAEMEVVA